MSVAPAVGLRKRLTMMLLGWGTVGLGYNLGRLAPQAAHVLQESALDRLVPFDASAVWLYLSFFLLVPAAYLLAEPARLKPLMRAMQMAAVAGAAVFLVWPTTLAYPPMPSGTPGSTALALLAGFDSAQNCLPSLHGTLALLAVAALWQRGQPWRNAFFLVWGLLVMYSVVQTRRHLSLDLAAGILLGACCAWLASRMPGDVQAARPDPCFPPEAAPENLR